MVSVNPKSAIFYGVFVAVLALYGSIVGAFYLGAAELSGAIMNAIASMTPIILSDLSLPGEVTPAVLGGVMAFTAPTRTSWVQTVLLLLLSGLCWLLYLHMQVFFTTPEAATALQLADIAPAKLETALSALASFSGSVRSFAAVIFAAILGLRFNRDVPVLGPADGGAP